MRPVHPYAPRAARHNERQPEVPRFRRQRQGKHADGRSLSSIIPFPLSILTRSGASEREASQPSCHYGGQHRNRTVEPGLTGSEIEHRRVDPDLRDDERSGLPADDVLVTDKEYLHEISSGWHIGRKHNRRAEQSLAEEIDFAQPLDEQPRLLLRAFERRAKRI